MIFTPLQFPMDSDDGDIQCENITITDDTRFEGNETFTVTLTTSTPRVDLMNDETNITIIDNDGTYVLWSVYMCSALSGYLCRQHNLQIKDFGTRGRFSNM